MAALAAAVAVAFLRLTGEADLARGRERLLAGSLAEAEAAFSRARLWPGARERATAGLALAAAAAGRDPASPAAALALDAGLSVPGEALVLEALAAERLAAAAALARLMQRAGHPLGPLYAAVAALEGGDSAAAWRFAALSRVPLGARGLGARLERALAAREAGAAVLLLDRSGELVATAGAAGPVPAAAAELLPDSPELLPGLLDRLPPLPAGAAVRLAVDLELSRAALAALSVSRGSIVLVDVQTGGLLAAVSDAVTAAREPAAPFTQRREPASIAKLLTAAAAYRSGALDPDAAIAHTPCTGVERYDGKPLWCAFPSGPLAGFDDALAQSCNVAFANIGTRLGAAAMLDEYARWGFDAGPGSMLGGAGRVHTAPAGLRAVADLSIGLELVDVTPLHAALLAAAVAGGGRMPEPWLVAGPCGPLGLTGARAAPLTSRSVLDPAVARRLRQAMEAVVRSGTGAGLDPPGFRVAMKTGTAAEYRLGYHVNYIGFAPLPDPKVAFCVRLTHGRNSPAVTRAARDVTRRLLLALASRPT